MKSPCCAGRFIKASRERILQPSSWLKNCATQSLVFHVHPDKGINLKERKSKFNKSLYKKLRPVRIVLIVATLVLMFFTKPAWCVQLADQISSDCMVDSRGVVYYTMRLRYIDPIYSFFLQIVTELVVLLCYAQKMTHYTDRRQKEKVFIVKMCLFGATALAALLYAADVYLPLNTICFILFLCSHNKIIRRAFVRVGRIVAKVSGMLLFYLVVLLFSTALIYVLVFDLGERTQDSSEFYTFSYSSAFRVFVSLLFMITTNNTPDMALADPQRRMLYTTIYVLLSLFNFVMASGIILAVINYKYRELLIGEIEEGSRNMPEYHRDMMRGLQKIEDTKFRNYDELEDFAVGK